MSLNQDIESVLYTEEQLKHRVQEVAQQITEDYKNTKNIMLVAILKGSYIFMSDLSRMIDLPVTVDFMVVSSYGSSSVSSGNIKIKKDLPEDLTGYNIILVEDILDTGNTLYHLSKILQGRGAESIKICTLMDKPERRTKPIQADYFCFTIPNAFVVGYGLDYDQKYRNLPYVGILKPSVYA